MNIKRAFAIFLIYLPLKVFSQWVTPYMTGQGAGYSVGDSHNTFDGYIIADSLVTFGLQALGSFPNTGYEYYQDSYGSDNGGFGNSRIIYQWSGQPTNNRKAQNYRRYSHGYIVNKWSGSLSDSIRYIRNFDGSLVRVDSGQRKLIPTTQLVDTTNSFLTASDSSDLYLIDWFNGDTLQSFLSDSIASQYSGGLSPSGWRIAEYHNDGEYIYLRVAESQMAFTYGFDILKLNIESGRLEDYHTFREFNPCFSSSQGFSIIVEDSIFDSNNQYYSFKSVYDRQWNKIRSLSYVADKFYGSITVSSPIYFSDSIIIFSTLLSDYRVPQNNRVIGSHIRVFDNINGVWLGDSRFQGAVGGDNFDIKKILAVRGGYIYLVTQKEAGSSDLDLLVCLPFDLKYDNSLFLRSLGELEEQNSRLLEIFPNPVSEFLNLNYGATFDEIRLYNQAGGLISVKPYSKENRYSTKFLPPGIYYLSLMSGDSALARRKFLKIDK
jgi:hypothetical protein